MGRPCLVGQDGDICILTTTTTKDFKTNNCFQKYLWLEEQTMRLVL